jgi:hypothetical protein
MSTAQQARLDRVVPIVPQTTIGVCGVCSSLRISSAS